MVQAVCARILTAYIRIKKANSNKGVFVKDMGCEHAFEWVRAAPANAPVLAHPDFTKQFTF